MLSTDLFKLEKESSSGKQMELIEKIYREAHSLKGAARSVNANVIEAICQSLEDGFALLKRSERIISPEILDALHRAVDTLNYALSTLEAERTASDRRQVREIISRLISAFNPEPPESEKQSNAFDLEVGFNEKAINESDLAETPITEEDFSSPTPFDRTGTGRGSPPKRVRISATALDNLLLQSEELLSTKQVGGQRLTDMQGIVADFTVWKKRWITAHKELCVFERAPELKTKEKATSLAHLIEFLNWNSEFIKLLESQMEKLIKQVEQDQRAFGMLADALLEDVKRILMLPASTLLAVFPKLVRELALDQGKEVELLIEGSEIEIDKRILEEMKDPLIHLVRNSIDHGIEKPEERKLKNKSPRGSLKLMITQKSGDKIEIQISDDGAGIDVEKLKETALRSNFISPEEALNLSDQEALKLIFHSGMSTSPIITDISGRGLGLAIVQEKVEKTGGTASVETSLAEGTTFRLALPITLATFRGILIRLGEHLFVLPIMNVYRVARVRRNDIKMVSNQETISVDEETVELVRLEEVIELELQKSRTIEPQTKEYYHVVILAQAHKKIGFVVDEILHEQEIIVKPLGRQLSRIRNIIGAALLGTGKVVPILNVSDLLKSAKFNDISRSPVAQADEVQAKKKSVLIAEDTITARMLLKNILMAAGYDVKTAVDGADALRALRNEEFDLVVSDVEMPRLNGFDLTTRIRADKKLAELPVVLVTSLDSREDRERGIDVGANAYIVKSSFDQSNLLEVIRRLI